MINKYNNTFSEELVSFLLSSKSPNIRRRLLYKFAKERFEVEKSVCRQNIYRLKKNGFLEQKEDTFCLSEKGIEHYSNKYRRIKEGIKKDNKIIFIFDIPEEKKKTREWIRNQIKFWDFKMIQKSVWVGYGPFPKDFSNRLKLLEVDKCVKIFNVESKLKP